MFVLASVKNLYRWSPLSSKIPSLTLSVKLQLSLWCFEDHSFCQNFLWLTLKKSLEDLIGHVYFLWSLSEYHTPPCSMSRQWHRCMLRIIEKFSASCFRLFYLKPCTLLHTVVNSASNFFVSTVAHPSNGQEQVCDFGIPLSFKQLCHTLTYEAGYALPHLVWVSETWSYIVGCLGICFPGSYSWIF